MSALRSAARRVPGLRPGVRALRRLALRSRADVATLDWAGSPIRVHVSSDRIVHSRLHPVAKEPWTAAWLESRVGTNDVVWDIGANIGAYALIAAALGAARVVALEPAAANFAALCANVELNGRSEIVLPLPLVLSEQTGLATLASGEDAAGATHRIGAGGQQVVGFGLDELLERFALPHPTLLKLDVDGAEAAVLRGAAATLADPRLRSVLIEVEDASGDEIIDLAKTAGLGVRERYDSRDGNPLNGVWYGIFERA